MVAPGCVTLRCLSLCAVVAAVLPMGGCFTPVVASSGYFGVGLFDVHKGAEAEGVRHTRVTGLGLLTGYGSTSLGATSREVLLVEPTTAGVAVETPRWQVMTGARAETDGPSWVLEGLRVGSNSGDVDEQQDESGERNTGAAQNGDLP